MLSPTTARDNRLLSVLATAALLFLLLTAGLRMQSAWGDASLPPGVNVTSGCEEESFFAIWRLVHKQPVYSDPAQPPYAAAYFNWLFYRSYGAVVTPAVESRGAVALVRYGRLFTLVGALCGASALGVLAWRLIPSSKPAVRAGGLAVAAFTFLGPLAGWWIVTVRPDLWATTLASCGLVLLLVLWRHAPVKAAAVAAVCFYAAWSFKQNFVQSFGISLIFLLFHRRWKSAAILLALSTLGWCATMFALGPDYRSALLSTVAASSYKLMFGWENLGDAFVRILPLIAAAGCLPFLRPPDNEPPIVRDTLRLGVIGLPLALSLSFAASCKFGASINYYFTPMFFVALLALVSLSRATSLYPAGMALIGMLALCVYLLAARSLHLRPDTVAITRQRWALWQNAPSPRYSDDQRFNLPWLNPSAPVYFTAFHYANWRAQEKTFAHDGIGGLIRRHHFAALLLPDFIRDTYDGSSLDGYERGPSAAGVALWLQRLPEFHP